MLQSLPRILFPLVSSRVALELWGRIALVSRFLPQICLQMLEHTGYAHEDQNAELHLGMDPFFPAS